MIINNSVSPCFKGYVGNNLKKMVKEGNAYDKEKKERNNEILCMMERRMEKLYSKNTVLDLVQDKNGERIVLTNPVFNKITRDINLPDKEVVLLNIEKESDDEVRKSKISENLENAHKVLTSCSSWGAEELLADGITNITKACVDLLDKIYGGNHNNIYKTLRKELKQYNVPGRNELNKLNILTGEEPVETFQVQHTVNDIVF